MEQELRRQYYSRGKYGLKIDSEVTELDNNRVGIILNIAEGKVAKEIATQLDISVYTVDAHRGRIMKKLDLRSSTEIVRFAMRKGLVE